MFLQLVRFLLISLEILIAIDEGLAQSQMHTYAHVKVDEQFTIRWAKVDQGNEALCSVKCIWTNCPGFKWSNQTCLLLEANQTLSIATRANGTSLFLRQELIQKVESALAYNGETFHEFIPFTSPLNGFPMTFPDPPTSPHQVLMDFDWGFHVCNTVERTCHRWYFGTDEWIPMPGLNLRHAEVRDMIRVNQTWWILGGLWNEPKPNTIVSPNEMTEYMDEAGHWHRGPRYYYRYLEGLGIVSKTSLLIVGGSHSSNTASSSSTSVRTFNLLAGGGQPLPNLPQPLHGVTCINYAPPNGTKMILCLGGVSPRLKPQSQNNVYAFDLETMVLKEITQWKFPETLNFSNLAWFQGNLYVVGARYGQSHLNTVFKFDETKQPAWTVVDVLPYHPRRYSRVRTFMRSLAIL